MTPTTCGDGQKFNCCKEYNEKGEAIFFIIGLFAYLCEVTRSVGRCRQPRPVLVKTKWISINI